MNGSIFLLVAYLSLIANAFPERGKWSLSYNDKNTTNVISKTMFNKTTINIDLNSVCGTDIQNRYKVEFLMIRLECYAEAIDLKLCVNEKGSLMTDCACTLYQNNTNVQTALHLEFRKGSGIIDCKDPKYTPDKDNDMTVHENNKESCPSLALAADKTTKAEPLVAKGESTTESDNLDTAASTEKPTSTKKIPEEGATKPKNPPGGTELEDLESGTEHQGGEPKLTRRRRDEGKAARKPGQHGGGGGVKSTPKVEEKKDNEINIAQSWRDGQYSVFISITPEDETKSLSPVNVTVTTRDSRGKLLSAADFPYLYFYLIMTIVYVFFGFFWLLMLACYWRDLLRIQYFIGLVIILGLIEKIFYYSEWQHVDAEGYSTKTLVIIAELVSVVKKTLARALVVIVSVGFGLIKPRLGPTLHKLIAVCFIYFVLAAVEGCLRVMKTAQDEGKNNSDLIAIIPLSLCETGIVYWVFSSLLQTIRTLRLRRNVAKLSLYRHFTNLLIFTVLASVAYFIWDVKELKLSSCKNDIRELWLRDGFWPMLFCIVLMVIMILWRPSINNQRFSHSLLLENEDGDEEEDTLMMSEAFDAKKRQQTSNGKVPRDKRKSREEKVEDDLQWIEDNIPASVADQALQPVLNDSEEEIMTTRFELSKMD